MAAGADPNRRIDHQSTSRPFFWSDGDFNDPHILIVDGHTPLTMAIQPGNPTNVEVIKALLAGGADPNLAEGESGKSPLAICGTPDRWCCSGPVVRALINAGARPGLRWRGKTAVELIGDGAKKNFEHCSDALAVMNEFNVTGALEALESLERAEPASPTLSCSDEESGSSPAKVVILARERDYRNRFDSLKDDGYETDFHYEPYPRASAGRRSLPDGCVVSVDVSGNCSRRTNPLTRRDEYWGSFQMNITVHHAGRQVNRIRNSELVLNGISQFECEQRAKRLLSNRLFGRHRRELTRTIQEECKIAPAADSAQCEAREVNNESRNQTQGRNENGGQAQPARRSSDTTIDR